MTPTRTSGLEHKRDANKGIMSRLSRPIGGVADGGVGPGDGDEAGDVAD